MDVNSILSKDEIEQIYKEIRLNPEYLKHQHKYNQWVRQGDYMKAHFEQKVMKEMEIKTFEIVAKQRINIWEIVKEKIAHIPDEDKQYLNISSNALRMIADVIEVFIMDINTIMKRNGLNDVDEYNKLQNALNEAKSCVRVFDNLTNDEKVINMFGDGCDNLYKLVFNKASSFVNKVKKYEESAKKKSTHQKKIA
jgi:hypothetical protein